jgi:hypothetical protein
LHFPSGYWCSAFIPMPIWQPYLFFSEISVYSWIDFWWVFIVLYILWIWYIIKYIVYVTDLIFSP